MVVYTFCLPWHDFEESPKHSSMLGNGRNTVSRVLFRRRELTEPHWVFGANLVSSAKNWVSSLCHTNSMLRGTDWVLSPEHKLSCSRYQLVPTTYAYDLVCLGCQSIYPSSGNSTQGEKVGCVIAQAFFSRGVSAISLKSRVFSAGLKA